MRCVNLQGTKSVTERMSVDETPIHTLNDTIKY